MAQFKVGDRVACPKWYARDICYGTICEASGNSVGVSLDSYSAHRHNCAGHCVMGHGWYFSASDLKLVTSAPVKTKKDLIIEKIKYLQTKFEERKKTYDF